eukprot:CAMPEP_0206172330 /NCGR_PEP_ID=MMETSP1474-20131121/45306_1 /ASSEMBLY_ACC=CAM_ASM_001110 /TAXON_ID=97495 /ORGANISM="Imantonia sp., Strain RCC918" /LENGTH=38 /DNA_ID= /DNA_START= /DNA_END= /DNA_ORIENTATION=
MDGKEEIVSYQIVNANLINQKVNKVVHVNLVDIGQHNI